MCCEIPKIGDYKKIFHLQISDRTEEGRIRRYDVIKEPFGVKGVARDCSDEFSSWNNFITPEMMDIIVVNTNNSIDRYFTNCTASMLDSSKYPYLRCINRTEIYAFIGLFYYRGLYNTASMGVNILFNEEKGQPMYGAAMSHEKFRLLLSQLSFDHVPTRQVR